MYPRVSYARCPKDVICATIGYIYCRLVVMNRSLIFIALGIVQIIILTLMGLYFYRL
ncbi:MAG: hypothetical protein AAB547_02425 [Patescibacteria group bacterium]